MPDPTTLDCGHPPTPQPPGTGGTGTAHFPDGRTACYACSDDHERVRLATAVKVYGYLSGDGRAIMTWPGGNLASVTTSTTRRVGFRAGNGKRPERVYFTAVDASGTAWHGQSAGPNMCATMRRGAK